MSDPRLTQPSSQPLKILGLLPRLSLPATALKRVLVQPRYLSTTRFTNASFAWRIQEQLRDTSERLKREESRLRRVKLQFVLENKVSNLPILHSNGTHKAQLPRYSSRYICIFPCCYKYYCCTTISPNKPGDVTVLLTTVLPTIYILLRTVASRTCGGSFRTTSTTYQIFRAPPFSSAAFARFRLLLSSLLTTRVRPWFASRAALPSPTPIVCYRTETAQTVRRPHEETEDTVATTASYTWSARSSRSSTIRSGSAEARGRFGEGTNDAREDDGRGRSAAQPSAKLRGGSWYTARPAVAPEANDAFVPRDGTRWLQGMLRGGFRRKNRQAVAPSPTTGQRDSLEARSSGRQDEGARHGAAEATSALPPAPAPTAGVTRGRRVNADGAARELGPTVIPEATTARRREAATMDTPHLPQPVSVDPGKQMDNTLKQMHDFLNNGFALLETQNGSACRRKSLVLAAAAAESRGGAPTVGTDIPPSVWVKHYLDESSKYGLGFALADGSIGVRLNGGRSIVLDSAGVAFDYVEHARRSSSQDNGGGRGGTKGTPVRKTYTLEDFPHDLKKNVNLLHSVRGRLRQGARNDDGEAPAQLPAEDGATNEGSPARGQTTRQPLVFVKKFRRTKRTLLFQLSNGTVQVRVCGGGVLRGELWRLSRIPGSILRERVKRPPLGVLGGIFWYTVAKKCSDKKVDKHYPHILKLGGCTTL